MTVRQALFLVGGKGSRLGAVTADTPKPLLEVAQGVSFIDLLINNAARHGFTDIVLLAGHHGDLVEARYAGRRIGEATIRVVREPTAAGTGGALKHAAGLLQEWFLLANGDSLFDINLRAFATPTPPGALARLALRRVPDTARYGAVKLSGDRIAAFHEKQALNAGPGLINGGVYLLGRGVCDLLADKCSLERDVFPALAARGLATAQAFDDYFLDIGLPETLAQGRRELMATQTRPAAFLDRDGVLNRDDGYTHRPEQLAWVDGAREAVRALNDAGYLVFVITNQAGVARGYYSEADVHAFHAHMQEQLAETGAHVDAFHHCPFHPEALVERYRHADHPERKPNPGMILRALNAWPVRRAGSFVLGDSASDVEAARRAGLPGFLFTGGDLLAEVRRCMAETCGAAALMEAG